MKKNREMLWERENKTIERDGHRVSLKGGERREERE